MLKGAQWASKDLRSVSLYAIAQLHPPIHRRLTGHVHVGLWELIASPCPQHLLALLVKPTRKTDADGTLDFPEGPAPFRAPK